LTFTKLQAITPCLRTERKDFPRNISVETKISKYLREIPTDSIKIIEPPIAYRLVNIKYQLKKRGYILLFV